MHLVKDIAWLFCLLIVALQFSTDVFAQAKVDDRPNVILIMTDDQGVGDLGVMGNNVIETPHIDRLASESAWLTNFYVHPVCAPTRACLMTGRYNYRTRAIDTYIGRAMMEPDEQTIAELLSGAGYATGIFGKWHLGDCYPMRAMDQGFQTSVVHRGGGIGQPSDPLDARRQYTDPVLFRNGVAESFKGYCTDIYYDEAIDFIQSSRDNRKPFFVYLADNTPHGPFHDVPKDLYDHYAAKEITRDSFGQNAGHKLPEQKADFLARVFAMIGNVDQNVGRVLDKLDELSIERNTIVIFMCDNGPNSQRYVMGYRGHKSSVYEGGIRSPFFIRWPGQFAAGSKLKTVAAHIDVLPTLLSCCDVPVPENLELDGIDLSASLRGHAVETPARNLFIQTHRGNQPTRYHHVAIRNQQWKLVHASGFNKERFEGQPKFELYNLADDAFEKNDVADQHPALVEQLVSAYDTWFDDVSSTRNDNYAPPRIAVDFEKENPIVLTRQDWRRTSDQSWGSNGKWLMRVEKATTICVRCRVLDKPTASAVHLHLTGHPDYAAKTGADNLWAEFKEIALEPGSFELTTTTIVDGEKAGGALQVFVEPGK